MSERYFSDIRQITGRPYAYHAYVREIVTGRVAVACRHLHNRRNGVSGAVFAQRCADRMRRRIERQQKQGDERGDDSGERSAQGRATDEYLRALAQLHPRTCAVRCPLRRWRVA